MLKNSNRSKILRNNNVDRVGEDRISKLPDAIIHHILSFLPTKCVMSTCILSKRWKDISNSVPTLDFGDWRATGVTAEEKTLELQQFMNFLDTVLYLHEKPIIQKFGLSFEYGQPLDESRVSKWIGTFIMRKVEELFLSVASQTSYILPLSFFTCNSLTVLKLDFIKLNVPNTVSFPRLKLLELGFVEFVNGISIEKLISNCPILEKLELVQCRCLGSNVICIANIALKNLYIENCYSFASSTLKICAPNLSTIRYELKEPGDFVIDSFPSLVEAYIYMPQASGPSVIKLLEKLSNVKLLQMTGACFLLPGEADILLMPAFNNLIHIEVAYNFFYWGSGPLGSFSKVRRFFMFLQLSPNLESVVFHQSICIPEEEDDGCWSVDPKCLPPHLKSMKFQYFCGEPAELNAIKLFLKYPAYLETVTIVAPEELSKDREELINVMKLLLMIPRPLNCVVKFLTSSKNS